VLGGLGWMATAIFKTEKITHQTIRKLQTQALQAETSRVGSASLFASQDTDDRDQELLRMLRLDCANLKN